MYAQKEIRVLPAVSFFAYILDELKHCPCMPSSSKANVSDNILLKGDYCVHLGFYCQFSCHAWHGFVELLQR